MIYRLNDRASCYMFAVVCVVCLLVVVLRGQCVLFVSSIDPNGRNIDVAVEKIDSTFQIKFKPIIVGKFACL
jgi:hypothetical protein